ncbi:MAG: orotidine-5'-phosphate decarboxylase [Deltaproteobacteria bacterium]|nr:orotidine-5'-phosphate decarboxylase [Deltaproteobacteria bacterium]
MRAGLTRADVCPRVCGWLYHAADLGVEFKPRSSKDRLVFALDVADLDHAERLVRQLSPYVGSFKIGAQLFTSAGPMVVDLVTGMGASVFLDTKFHDIPATVAAAAKAAARRRVRMLTVHALAGGKAIRLAVTEISRMSVLPGTMPSLVLGVTLLTSHTVDDVRELGFSDDVPTASLRLARLAVANGAGGIVASAQEVAALRAKLPSEIVIVTPGIRPKGSPQDDQARVMTPSEAIQAGADYLVVGRPIRDAPNPQEAAAAIAEEIASAVARL